MGNSKGDSLCCVWPLQQLVSQCLWRPEGRLCPEAPVLCGVVHSYVKTGQQSQGEIAEPF